MADIKSYRDLRIWQIGIKIVKEIYAITRRFPKYELFGLTIQMRRSAVSIPSNIAEGHNRAHRKEFAQFLNVALGSCAELETQITIAMELDYLLQNEGNRILEALDGEGRQIRSLIAKLASP